MSPKWELAALRALMKPQTKGAIEHQRATQRWPRRAQAIILQTSAEVGERIGCTFDPHFPAAGEYFLAIQIEHGDLVAGRALAVVLSTKVPDVWFTLDRLFVYNGTFFRRRRGFRLELVPATNVHLPRAMRAALRGVL